MFFVEEGTMRTEKSENAGGADHGSHWRAGRLGPVEENTARGEVEDRESRRRLAGGREVRDAEARAEAEGVEEAPSGGGGPAGRGA